MIRVKKCLPSFRVHTVNGNTCIYQALILGRKKKFVLIKRSETSLFKVNVLAF